VRFDILRALFIGRRFVLASINLDDNASRVTDKIGDVAADANLAAEMCAGYRDAMAQVPPELALGVRQRSPHRAGEAALWWHDRTIALGPYCWLVVCGHFRAS